MYPQIEIVRTLSDNYSYIIRERNGNGAAIVDPGEAAPLIARIESMKLEPREIWLTHKHADHVGGASELARKYDIPIRGSDEIPEFNTRIIELRDGDKFRFGPSEVTVLRIGGHTRSHLVYLLDDVVLTGDALFIGGCGRIFEGTAADLYAGIYKYLRDLPANTRIYCGHEYAEKNLRFALTLEPGNSSVQQQCSRIAALSAQGRPSVPGEMGIERATNPFLRVGSSSLLEALRKKEPALSNEPAKVFTFLRSLRDKFQQ